MPAAGSGRSGARSWQRAPRGEVFATAATSCREAMATMMPLSSRSWVLSATAARRSSISFSGRNTSSRLIAIHSKLTSCCRGWRRLRAGFEDAASFPGPPGEQSTSSFEAAVERQDPAWRRRPRREDLPSNHHAASNRLDVAVFRKQPRDLQLSLAPPAHS